MKESDFVKALTILEQADHACSNHDSQAARLHLGVLKKLLNGFMDGAIVLPFKEVL